MAQLHFPKDQSDHKRLSRLYREGKLYRVRQGVYIDAEFADDLDAILNQRWYDIADYLFDTPVAVYRTAAELKPHKGRIYLVANVLQSRSVKVGSLLFSVFPGIVDLCVEPFVPGVYRSGLARQCLENLSVSRARSGSKKTLGKDWVETQLIRELDRRGESGLNTLRVEARDYASKANLAVEFELLNKMVSVILQTHPIERILETAQGLAVAKGEPFDELALQRFSALAAYLRKLELPALEYHFNKASWRNISFFESYFSNYIEGTRFTIDEAEQIVFSGNEINNRHQDSHDVLAHAEISGDFSEMVNVPDSADELVGLLKSRHKLLLAEREDKRPGQFKEKANKAGGTFFVLPEKLEGSLVHGFAIYESLPEGMLRALFMHFLIAECHPFDDGNGRLARIMMNAELVAKDLHKIIVPSVHRESYLNGMRQASHKGRFRAMVKVMHQLHQYAASIDWVDYGDARGTLEAQAADQDPDEGVPTFNKAISKFTGDYIAG